MRKTVLLPLLAILAGCATTPAAPEASATRDLAAAERVIDAFYSFLPERLSAALADAPESRAALLYYQGWAQGGNYAVLDRQPCAATSDTEITCPVTVRDDLIAALGTGFWVTDRFHMTLTDGRVLAVRNSSNDPPEFHGAMEWVHANRPEVMSGPCRDFFAGGPTPQDCVRAMVRGFADYRAAGMPAPPEVSTAAD